MTFSDIAKEMKIFSQYMRVLLICLIRTEPSKKVKGRLHSQPKLLYKNIMNFILLTKILLVLFGCKVTMFLLFLQYLKMVISALAKLLIHIPQVGKRPERAKAYSPGQRPGYESE